MGAGTPLASIRARRGHDADRATAVLWHASPSRWRRVLGAWPLTLCVILLMGDGALGHFENAPDFYEHKRELCYRLLAMGDYDQEPNIGNDRFWRDWINEAISIWNNQHRSSAGSLQIPWSFRPCQADETPDVVFQFDKDGRTTAGKGGATTGGFGGRTTGQLTVYVRPSFNWSEGPEGVVGTKDTVYDTRTRRRTVPTGGFDGSGWSRTGATTMDPVLVIAHELTQSCAWIIPSTDRPTPEILRTRSGSEPMPTAAMV
jgi:hypothetical protein